MNYGTSTEKRRMAKKNQPAESRRPSEEAAFDRVEFQAPPGWAAQVDAAAESLGLSRSAYIRMAVNRQMKADQKEN